MDQQYNQNNEGQYQRIPMPPPIAPNPGGVDTNGQAIGAPNQRMLMGLMTNPAMAAAAAASPLFPPAALLTNPGAFFSMPDVFAASGTSSNPAVPTIQQQYQQPAIVPQGMQCSINNTATMYVDAMGNQVQHVQAGQNSSPQLPLANTAASMMFQDATVGMNYGNSSVRAHMMAAAAAAQAVAESEEFDADGRNDSKDLTAAERAKQNRDRNREHARSTRLRKKAYVQKLKELVEGLHSERTEEVRQRRVAIQHLAEMQNVRRSVIRTFMQFHSGNERDKRKWNTLLEEDVWLKQPVTPYRSFRRSEIEHECRMSRGVDAIISDASSVAVMIEGVGSRSPRWMQIKREDFFQREEERTGTKIMPRNVGRHKGNFQHAVSSLSSSSANSSNNGSSGEDSKTKKRRAQVLAGAKLQAAQEAGESRAANQNAQESSEGLHDYDAKPLPDPRMQYSSERGSSSPSEDSPEESNTSVDEAKPVSTDSSSGDDSANGSETRPSKRQKNDGDRSTPVPTGAPATTGLVSYLPENIAKKGGIAHNIQPFPVTAPTASRIAHARLSVAPAIVLPPFSGLGKRDQTPEGVTGVPDQGRRGGNGQVPNVSDRRFGGSSSEGAGGQSPVIISGDMETSSSNSSNGKAQINAFYHVNEDDMILMDDVLMCPFVFRTQDAVHCGALAECVMPGMLRANFSQRNKLKSLELTYDAMGFMQQLERASGSETTAQIIPGSLEMALSPASPEGRVITMAQPPYLIVSVNEAWTKLTKYTQMEVEGMELFKVLEGEPVEGQAPNAPYDLQAVGEGKPSCATRFHYDKDGEQFVDFICSYPLTNTSDDITHVIHISKKLPPVEDSVELQESEEAGSSR